MHSAASRHGRGTLRAVVIQVESGIACLREGEMGADERPGADGPEDHQHLPPCEPPRYRSAQWELEDLAFRYLHPDTTSRIAKPSWMRNARSRALHP